MIAPANKPALAAQAKKLAGKKPKDPGFKVKLPKGNDPGFKYTPKPKGGFKPV